MTNACHSCNDGVDKDGKPCHECHGSGKKVVLKRGLLIERLQLEDDMLPVCCKICNFIAYFGTLLIALNTFYPSATLATVHDQLRAHYGLDADSMGDITTVPALFEFVHDFQTLNEALMATSQNYWCDPRFLHDTFTKPDSYSEGDHAIVCESSYSGGRRLQKSEDMKRASFERDVRERRMSGGSSYSGDDDADDSSYSSGDSSGYSGYSGGVGSYSGYSDEYTDYSSYSDTVILTDHALCGSYSDDVSLLPPFYSNPQNFGDLEVWDCNSPCEELLQRRYVARQMGMEFGETAIEMRLDFLLTSEALKDLWIDDSTHSHMPDLLVTDMCNAMAHDLVHDNNDFLDVDPALAAALWHCKVIDAEYAGFSHRRLDEDDLQATLRFLGLQSYESYLQKEKVSAQMLATLSEEQLDMFLPIGPKRTVLVNQKEIQRRLASFEVKPKIKMRIEFVGPTPLESEKINKAVHHARLDTDRILDYLKEEFDKRLTIASQIPLWVNASHMERVSIEEINHVDRFTAEIDVTILSPTGFNLGPWVVVNYQSIFETIQVATEHILHLNSDEQLLVWKEHFTIDGKYGFEYVAAALAAECPGDEGDESDDGGGGGHRRLSGDDSGDGCGGDSSDGGGGGHRRMSDYLEEWLPEYARYAALLESEGITPTSLMLMTDDDLGFLGIPKVARQKLRYLRPMRLRRLAGGDDDDDDDASDDGGGHDSNERHTMHFKPILTTFNAGRFHEMTERLCTAETSTKFRQEYAIGLGHHKLVVKADDWATIMLRTPNPSQLVNYASMRSYSDDGDSYSAGGDGDGHRQLKYKMKHGKGETKSRRMSADECVSKGSGHPQKIGPQEVDHHVYPRENPQQTDKYFKKKKFPYTQIAILPPVIYQTRYPSKPCDPITFAATYNNQSVQTHLALFGMNQDRDSTLLRCVDKSKMLEVEIDHLIETDSFDFQGKVIYAKFLGLDNLDTLERTSWIDMQTQKVEMATMTYSMGLEVYTVIFVEFELTEAGGINPKVTFESLVDLRNNGGLFSFALYYNISLALSIIALLVWLWETKNRCGKPVDRGGIIWYKPPNLVIIEFISIVLNLGLLVQISDVVVNALPVNTSFESLLQVFLDLHDMSHDGMHCAYVSFFNICTDILDEIALLGQWRMLSFVVILFQFMQLNIYMRVHPRIAVLANTLMVACDDTLHFLILFGIIFFILAFLAHWSLGASIEAYATFGMTCEKQFQMVIGEYPWDSLDGLSEATTIMFLVYLVVYAVVCFFILVNFFLAIIVDSFYKVKEIICEQVTENSSIYDSYEVVYKYWMYHIKRRFPPRQNIIDQLMFEQEKDNDQQLVEKGKRWLKDEDETKYQAQVDAEMLMKCKLPGLEGNRGACERFLQTYLVSCPDLEFHEDDLKKQQIDMHGLRGKMRERQHVMLSIAKEGVEGDHFLARAQEDDAGFIQLNVSTLDEEIGRKKKELEIMRDKVLEKEKFIKEKRIQLEREGGAAKTAVLAKRMSFEISFEEEGLNHSDGRLKHATTTEL